MTLLSFSFVLKNIPIKNECVKTSTAKMSTGQNVGRKVKMSMVDSLNFLFFFQIKYRSYLKEGKYFFFQGPAHFLIRQNTQQIPKFKRTAHAWKQAKIQSWLPFFIFYFFLINSICLKEGKRYKKCCRFFLS